LTYGHGCGTIDNAAITELVADFPNHKGNVVGCMKCFYGMAAAVITVVYNAVFAPNQKGFLIFIGIYAAISGLALVPVIRHCKGRIQESNEWVSKKFKILAFSIIAVSFYILAVNCLKHQIDDSVGKSQ